MRKGDAESKTEAIQTTQVGQSKEDLMELHQVNSEQQRLAEHRLEEIIQLRRALADKEEELSKSVKRWQMGTLDHVEVVKQLNSEKVKLDRCHQKCAALEESRRKQLQEMQEAHQREIFDAKQQFEKALAQQEQRRLREISHLDEKSKELEKRLTEKLGEKDEQTKLRLSLHEEMFKRILREKMAEFSQERTDLEEEMKKQLLFNEETCQEEPSEGSAKVNRERADPEEAKEKSLKTRMGLLCHQWRVREQQWHQQKQQLEEMLEEREMSREWLVLASKMEIHHLREKILQLKDQEKNKRTETAFWRRLTGTFRRQKR